MKISYTTLACPDWPLERIIAAAQEYGYDGIDFRGYLGEMAVYKLGEFTSDAAATARRIADAGIEVSCFSSSARLCQIDTEAREAATEEVRQYARLCEAFSAPQIRVFGGSIPEGSRDDAVALACDVLEEMAVAAAPATVAVETHDSWIETPLLAKLFERVRAENVCVLWDLHHPFRMVGETPKQTYENIGRYVGATHLKDSRPAPDGEYEYTLPGDGDVPLAEMVGLLKAGGYDGYLTLEWEKAWHPELADADVALPAYAEFMRKLARGSDG